jgi:hypothetical protein
VFSTLELTGRNDALRPTSINRSSSAVPLELQYDVHGLKRASLYSLVVQAFNSKGAGPSSNEVQCRTKEKDPPSLPKFRIVRVTVSSVTISWIFSNDLSTEIAGKILV